MGIEHKEPTPATAKQLYGTAFICAHPDCQQPLYRLATDGTTRVLNSTICHIAARSEGGPRWDPDMSEEVNASVENLLLLCLLHSPEVDSLAMRDKFPPELLRQWKAEQLRITEQVQRAWQLTDIEAEDVLRASSQISIVAQTVQLGGSGGQGHGAGGGGGGAIGPGAVGGPGGAGGRLIVGERIAGTPEEERSLRMFKAILERSEKMNYGAGAGGAGSVGPGAVGEAGGAGGDTWVDEIWIPTGTHEVLPGRRGEDTIVNLFDEDGFILDQYVVRQADVIYNPYPPTRGRDLTADDLDAGFGVRTTVLAETFMVRRGMVDLLHALWTTYAFEKSPFRALWTLVLDFDTGRLGVDDLVELQVLVRNPGGQCRLFERFDVRGSEATEKSSTYRILKLNFTGAEAGTWTMEITSKRVVLTTIRVRVDCPPPIESEDGGGTVILATEREVPEDRDGSGSNVER